MANRRQFTVKQFIDAIPGTGGVIASIAKRVGCDWHTAQKYIQNYQGIKKVYEDECQTIDDYAVSTILKAIKDGDIATAKWWLSKKRRAEYGDQIDLTSRVETNDVVLYLPEREKDNDD